MLSVTQDSQEAPELCCHFLKAHCLFNYLKFKHFTVSSYTVCCEKLSKKELQGKKRRKKKTLSDTKSICVCVLFLNIYNGDNILKMINVLLLLPLSLSL